MPSDELNGWIHDWQRTGEDEEPDKVASTERPERLAWFLAMLRAAHQLHWTAHWQTHGPSFFADHLLFERLYNGVTEEIDGLAEKLVGINGMDAVNPVNQMHAVAELTDRWVQLWPDRTPEGLVGRAAQIESDILEALRELLNPGFSGLPGLDNLLQGFADNHETNSYLLTQRAQSVGRVAARYFKSHE